MAWFCGFLVNDRAAFARASPPPADHDRGLRIGSIDPLNCWAAPNEYPPSQTIGSDGGIVVPLTAGILGTAVSIYSISFHQRGDIIMIRWAAGAFSLGAVCAISTLFHQSRGSGLQKAFSKLAPASLVGSVFLVTLGIILLTIVVAQIDPQVS